MLPKHFLPCAFAFALLALLHYSIVSNGPFLKSSTLSCTRGVLHPRRNTITAAISRTWFHDPLGAIDTQEMGVFHECIPVSDMDRCFASVVVPAESYINETAVSFQQVSIFGNELVGNHSCVLSPDDVHASLFYPLTRRFVRVSLRELHCLLTAVGRLLTLTIRPRDKQRCTFEFRTQFIMMHRCLSLCIPVSYKCRYLKVMSVRGMYSRHDFVALRRSYCRVHLFTVVFLIALRARTIFSLAICTESDTFGVSDRTCDNARELTSGRIGGGRVPKFAFDIIQPYVDCSGGRFESASQMKFVGHKHERVAEVLYKDRDDHVYGKVPLEKFVSGLVVKDIRYVAKVHGVHVPSKIKAGSAQVFFKGHHCHCCETHVSVFAFHSVSSDAERSKAWYDRLGYCGKESKRVRQRGTEPPAPTKRKRVIQQNSRRLLEKDKPPVFPPPPPAIGLKESIIRGWCEDMSPENFAEGGCAVCGQLTPFSQLSKLSETNCDLGILTREGMGLTRQQRLSSTDPVQEIKGPVIDDMCTNICMSCTNSLAQGLTPKYALANGLWLGAVPDQLRYLSYAEQLLVSRVRRSKCIVKVSSGMHKMKANVIMFENPMPKIYQRLPPPVEDLDEVLAFIYTGPCQPTPADMERTPLLVRRRKVGEALEWLRLNHIDYRDLDIAYDNLASYPESGPPVVVTYRSAVVNKNPESVSAFDNDKEEGVDSGPCPFVVNGITGEKLDTMGPKALAARAAAHLRQDDGKILAIGHAEKPVSMYDNPQLYPMMFPWLFPYGLGGIGCVDDDDVRMSDMMHKRKLLMYHDKRFQMDAHFPLIAFNQEQIKNSTTGGYLLTERRDFDDIAERLMNIDVGVLEDLSRRLERGDRVKPVTDEERACYALISDLDHVGGHVQGSITSKKFLRNEIWSLVSYVGAPSWFITFAPADSKHPLCLYYADTKETFSPDIRPGNECYRLIANNPVASARFFHFMVRMFIKHVLGVDQDHPGLYGDTAAYYGTVEQQGRLTLHLHLLLWILGSLTPQEIRDKIMDVNSDFQKKMVEYLESLCVGELLTGSKVDVSDNVGKASKSPEYRDPTLTLPDAPLQPCADSHKDCQCAEDGKRWWNEFDVAVDDLLLRSNQHVHTFDKDGNNTSYCTNYKGECKRRFPRETFEQTLVDPKTGALNLKKGEAWMNTITPLLTYVLRSNSDVTSLLSGTAIKAIVAYISDYITKPGLKTYSVFDVVKSIFDKNSEMIGGDLKRREKVRKIFTQVVNSLTAKLEIGGPMASLYVLGNPDHYTGHTFIPFYWKGYVREVLDTWKDDVESSIPDLRDVRDSVVINKSEGRFIGISKISDYVYRPETYEQITLYDWIRLYKKSKKRRTKKKQVEDAADDPDFDVSDDELNILPVDSHSSVKAEKTVEEGTDAGPVEYDIDCFNDTEDLEDDEADELDVMSEKAENTSKTDHSFCRGHPQARTHEARMSKEDPLVVPTFLPNTLPRSDRGDREYYCCTMLTFFKPWRTGDDLRSKFDSWDKSFVAHEFTKRQIEVMKYFNVRYECLDARDDYAAKKDKEGGGMCYQWATPDLLVGLDSLDDGEILTGGDFDPGKEPEGFDEDDLMILGRRGMNRRNEMLAAERTMRLAGWLDECVDGLPDVGSLIPIKPERDQPSKAWRAAVLARKKAILDEKNENLPTNKAGSSIRDFKPDVVEVVDRAYIDKIFEYSDAEDKRLIDDTIRDYHLNPDQERAFRIIANHALMDNPERLQMYIGGMGGTGKSQVIKALIHFFGERKENHRFVVVAPTGAAAALLNGSTYHSVLGINDGEFVSAKSLALIRARLDGVDYIFLDEVSMISCRDLYKISAQTAKVRVVYDEPFGGINFIFAGDFAQLPPARSGPTLYSGSVGTQMHSGQSVEEQESAIGKALWHQITTVVILRQNMRQALQSEEDSMLRTALENMRYKSCTPDDIAFLRTRIAGKGPDDPKLAQKDFRNVSIITARNSQRDKLNELGCERFAAENNQTLHSFYSIDKWRNPEEGRQRGVRGRPKKTIIDPVRKTNILSPRLQRILWDQPPASSNKHVAGKLTLCVGMPVMLKHNDATECCITKGAEATVVSWQSEMGPEGRPVLETLFVKLNNPPKTVKIDGLPENVVPITRHSTATMCYLPNDDEVSLSRDQVLVLLNFGMTDYSSQGRTRPFNPVDLNSCRTHQSYYTCLSRSASAAGTIIVQGFDPKVITGGASGYLRQEFRELELLDEITKLRYEKALPSHITGKRRNTVIRQFQQWKGTEYVPSNVHPSIHWNKQDPLDMLDVITDSPWQMVKRKKYDKNERTTPSRSNTTGFVAAKGTVPVIANSLVRKRDSEDGEDAGASGIFKRVRRSQDTEIDFVVPRGFIWDNENYSCAYDSIMTVLFSIWAQNPVEWKGRFKDVNRIMNVLATGFHRAEHSQGTMENARNRARHLLHQRSPILFPFGQIGTPISELSEQLLRSDNVIASTWLRCMDCGEENNLNKDLQTCVIQCSEDRDCTTSECLQRRFRDRHPRRRCDLCGGEIDKITRFDVIPKILVFSVSDSSVRVSKKISFHDGDSIIVFGLKGVVYFGDFHYTARICTNKKVWFHDGMVTGGECTYEKMLTEFTDSELSTCNGKTSTLVIYAQK
jgi:hypothetical protein